MMDRNSFGSVYFLRLRYMFSIVVGVLLISACDPMAPQPTPYPVVISPIPSVTPTPPATNTPTPTRTPEPTYTPYVPPTATPFPCDDDSGRIIDFNDFPSEVGRGENLRYRVYVPPCYQETQQRYPMVILLHGLSYREQQWEDLGAIAAMDQGIRLGALPPMILVMPWTGQLGQLNSFPPDISYETHILDELLVAIENDFCIWEDRDHRAIGGISRGAFWAISIAFRHPDIFGTVGGHSSYFPQTFDVPEAFNPLDLASNSGILPEANLRIYLDNGAADSASLSQQNLSNRLEERSIPHTYIINPIGEHDNDYWSAHVSEYLAFYGRNWPRQYAELPTCLRPSP